MTINRRDFLAALSGDPKTFILSVINATEEAQELAPQINGVKLRNAKTWRHASKVSRQFAK